MTWNIFSGLIDKTVRGVVATLGLFFGILGQNGSIEVSSGITFKRIMRLGRGLGRQALHGPYVIAKLGEKYEMLPTPPAALQLGAAIPPSGFRQQPWHSDYIYFKAKTCDQLKRPNSTECDIMAVNLVRMVMSTQPGYDLYEAYYLVPKTWATKR